MKEIILNILKDTKNYKKIAWVFLVGILLVVVLYPIIDANFLYYKRVSNRIEILENVSKIDENRINKNDKLKKEYNSIIEEISEKENNYLNNIFVNETSFKNKTIKFFSAAWLFIIVGLILPFTKDKIKNKRTWTNFFGGMLCIGVGCLFGYFGLKIPTIINIIVNIILYQIIMVYLAYTIATSGNKLK